MYGPCQQNRKRQIKEQCKLLKKPGDDTDTTTTYPHLYVDQTHRQVVCDAHNSFKDVVGKGFLNKGKTFVPMSSLGEEEQKKVMETYSGILLVRHPLRKVTQLYQDEFSHFAFADFIQAIIVSDDASLQSIMDTCLPCQMNYEYIVKVETLEGDGAYLDASSYNYGNEDCVIKTPASNKVYSEVLTEFDKLDMRQLASVLGKFSADLMMLSYQWKMSTKEEGIIIMSDGVNSQC